MPKPRLLTLKQIDHHNPCRPGRDRFLTVFGDSTMVDEGDEWLAKATQLDPSDWIFACRYLLTSQERRIACDARWQKCHTTAQYQRVLPAVFAALYLRSDLR